MGKNMMHHDAQRTRICKNLYRPSPNLFQLVKSVFAVLVIGESPINHAPYSKRKLH
jgi:hypothetical protein